MVVLSSGSMYVMQVAVFLLLRHSGAAQRSLQHRISVYVRLAQLRNLIWCLFFLEGHLTGHTLLQFLHTEISEMLEAVG